VANLLQKENNAFRNELESLKKSSEVVLSEGASFLEVENAMLMEEMENLKKGKFGQSSK